jgi:carboxymethylenebutenolidase
MITLKKKLKNLAAALPGVNVIAVDLYDGKIATNAEEAGATMQAVRKERAESLILGAYEIAGKSASIQTIGWCFGGGWSLQAAMLAGTKNIGCVMYYGMPEKEESKLKALNAPVLGIFATQDGWINKPVVDAFETQMKQLNKAITIHWYDAEHAFANPSNPKFNKDAASDAMTKSIAFIKSNFLQR